MVNASIGLSWQNGFPMTFQNLAQPFTYSGYPNQPRTYGLALRPALFGLNRSDTLAPDAEFILGASSPLEM